MFRVAIDIGIWIQLGPQLNPLGWPDIDGSSWKPHPNMWQEHSRTIATQVGMLLLFAYMCYSLGLSYSGGFMTGTFGQVVGPGAGANWRAKGAACLGVVARRGSPSISMASEGVGE